MEIENLIVVVICFQISIFEPLKTANDRLSKIENGL